MDRQEELVNKELVREWLKWGFFWSIFGPLIGILVSLKFNYPNFLNTEYTVFGRLRPIHINGVIFGFFTTVIFGLFYYMVPKITGVRLYREEWGKFLIPIWNLALTAGFIGIAAGYNNDWKWPSFRPRWRRCSGWSL